MNRLLTLLIVFIATLTQAQNLFPETFTGCCTKRFSLESDTIDVRIDEQTFIDAVFRDFSNKLRNSIKGKLTLQIIVYTDGTSCLLSMENETNIPSKKIKSKIKSAIDNELIWEAAHMDVSAIVILNFDGKNVSLQRMGMSRKRGRHLLVIPSDN